MVERIAPLVGSISIAWELTVSRVQRVPDRESWARPEADPEMVKGTGVPMAAPAGLISISSREVELRIQKVLELSE